MSIQTDSSEPEPEPGPPHPRHSAPAAWQVVAAFAAIYVLWGSTYLAIRFGVETIPPFLLAGTRFLVAGFLLFAVARWRGANRPSLRQWRDASIAGALMLMIGNGGVSWAEQVIPSGATALLVALVPLWMVLLDWARPGGIRPRALVMVGLAVGFVGVALLAREQTSDQGSIYGWGVVVLILSSIGWAWGSIFNRHADKPASPLLAVALQMIAGGAALMVLALGFGETKEFSLSQVTLTSAGAWLYLMVAGSIVGFTAYIWLLQVSTPARVSTYAYVNPFIAVLLGCTIGREPVSQELFVAGGLIVAAVALIVRSGSRSNARPAGKELAVESKACPISRVR